MEWTPVVSSALLLLFLCIPVEEKLGSDEAIAERRDHKGSSHEGVSSFLNGGEDSGQRAPKEQKHCDGRELTRVPIVVVGGCLEQLEEVEILCSVI